MAKYPINKGIGRSPEFKGLKSQYLFIFAGGLLALFVVFVIMYMAGIGNHPRYIINRRKFLRLFSSIVKNRKA